MAKTNLDPGSLFDGPAVAPHASSETKGAASSSSNTSDSLPFEQAFTRLEKILEKLNSESVPLEEALALYEEASQHLTLCNQRLNEAESRIEMLSKTRTGEVMMGADGKPLTQEIPGRT